MLGTKTAGTVLFLIPTLILSGCITSPPPVHAVQVSTSYDPSMTPAEDRQRADSMGLREGDPASHGSPEILVILKRTSASSDPGGSAIRCHVMDIGGVIDLSSKPYIYCFPLTDSGESRFGIRFRETVIIDRAQVVGSVTEDQDCGYAGASETRAVNLELHVSEDTDFILPFGIRC